MQILNQSEKLKKVLGVVVFIVVLGLIKFLVPMISLGGFKEFVLELGFWGPVAVTFYYVIAQVIAPMSGTPALALSIALFGMWPSMVYLYVGESISAVINFYISRKFGRKWVLKLTGKKTMKDIDDFVEVLGGRILIIGRVFGFALFDVISYAAGLTNISFKKYYLVTLTFALIPLICFAILFQRLDYSSSSSLLITLTALVSAALIFGFLIKRYIKKIKKE